MYEVVFFVLDEAGGSDSDTVVIEVIDNAPQIADIPDTTFTAGDTLLLSLDDFVSDCDDRTSQLQWKVSGNVNIRIDMSFDRVASLFTSTAWTGSESVIFTVTDPDENTASDTSVITVKPSTSVSEDVAQCGVPLGFTVLQNYPNPFNPTTSIRYTLSGGEGRTEDGGRTTPVHVCLRIYNVLGQEVATLVDTEQEPGYYTVTWDASGMASGVYFCTLLTGSLQRVEKLVLVP